MFNHYLTESIETNSVTTLINALGEDLQEKWGTHIGTDSDDIIKMGNLANIVSDGAGNDKTYLGGGDDRYISDTGDDFVDGAAGNDTYIFSKAHGNDTIKEYGQDKGDILQLTGINSSEVKYRKVGNDLTLFGYNDGDSITVKDFFQHYYNQIENFVFADM